jgi:hypothetical protein
MPMGKKAKSPKTSKGRAAEERESYGATAGAVHLLDVVALTTDLPAKGLLRGQVGTVVETLAPEVFEVEFSDDEGKTYATAALRAGQLIVLHYHPAKAG